MFAQARAVRVDFNVPSREHAGKIGIPMIRAIRKSLPTINYLREQARRRF